MLNLKRNMVALVIGCLLAAGAFAQKREDRPPRPPVTVVVAPKGEKPPPRNNSQGDKKQGVDKKGKN